ncbi:Uncharacterised protein [Streptococcus pneumoniae]|nr:Uncharacterised protein [Streptococcus pneumoniae]
MCFTHSFFHFATLRKSLQTTSASLCRTWLLTLSVSSTTSKHCFELTSSVLSASQNTVLSNLRLVPSLLFDFH